MSHTAPLNEYQNLSKSQIARVFTAHGFEVCKIEVVYFKPELALNGYTVTVRAKSTDTVLSVCNIGYDCLKALEAPKMRHVHHLYVQFHAPVKHLNCLSFLVDLGLGLNFRHVRGTFEGY
jgi:hypothetical protein